MVRAISSLPVPVSPWISTVLFIGETSSSVEKTCCIGALWPITLVEAETIVQLRAQLRVLLLQPAFVDAGVQHLRELRQLERLDQEVDGAALDGLDRFFDAARTRDDDGANLGIAGERRVEDVHAVGVGQPQIDDEAVVGKAFEPRLRIGRVKRLRDGEALGFERVGDELTKFGFVFDDENRGLREL